MRTMFAKTTAGMLALALVAAFVLGGCSGSTVDKKLNGTWIKESDKSVLKLNNGKYEFSNNSGTERKGTYSTKKGEITFVDTPFLESVYKYSGTSDTFILTSDNELLAMEISSYREQIFVKEKPSQLSRDVPIYINVINDRQGQIAKAIANSIRKAGFRTTKDEYSGNDLSVYFELNEVSVPNDPNKFVEYNLSFILTVGDTRTEAQVHFLEIKEQVSHANLAGAEKAAINAAVKWITDEYPAQLEAWL